MMLCNYLQQTTSADDICWRFKRVKLMNLHEPVRPLLTLTLKAPKNTSENVVCWIRLLQIIAYHYWRIKYKKPKNRSSLIWVHTVCHKDFLSADEKSRRLAAIGISTYLFFFEIVTSLLIQIKPCIYAPTVKLKGYIALGLHCPSFRPNKI